MARDDNDITQEIGVNQFFLQKIKLGLRKTIPPNFLRTSELSLEKGIADDIIYRFSLFLAGRKHEKEKVVATMKIPISWWEYTKETLFPKWIVKLYPIKYKTIKIKNHYFITNICPHIDSPTTQTHYDYILSSEEEKQNDR